MSITSNQNMQKESPLLYHYTSLEAAIQIITNKGLVFKGTRFDSMNDPMECIYAKEKILPIVKRMFPAIDEWKVFPYVVSFSKRKDDFLMWRCYHSEICLIVDSSKFPDDEWSSQTNCGYEIKHGDVDYVKTLKLEQKVQKKLDTINKNGQTQFLEFDLGMELFPFIKRRCWRYEKEYRLVKYTYETMHSTHDPSQENNCKITNSEIDADDLSIRKTEDGNLVSCRTFLLPKDSLEGIIIRCNNHDKYLSIANCLESFLKRNGYDLAEDFFKPSRTTPNR